MAPFNTPSSDSNDSTGFIRKPLSPAALAAAAIIGASTPQVAAQAQENYTDRVQATTTETKQKTLDLTADMSRFPEELRKNSTVNPLGLAKGKYVADGNYFDFGAEQNSQFWFVVRGDMARMVSEGSAIDIEIAGGPKQRELLLKAGWKVSEKGMLRVTAHQLRQLMTFDFEAGRDSTWMEQKTIGATLRIKSDSKFLDFLEVNGYISKSDSKELEHKTFVVDSATFLSLFEDQRRIAGVSKTGMSGTAKIRLGENDTVKLTIGAERREEDTLIPTGSKIKTTGGAEWTHNFSKEYSASVGVSTTGPTTSVRLAGNKNGENGTVSVFAQQNISQNGIGGVGGDRNITLGIMANIQLDPVKTNKLKNRPAESISESPAETAAAPKSVSYSQWEAEQKAKDATWNFEKHQKNLVAANSAKVAPTANDGLIQDTPKMTPELIAFMKERVGYNPTFVEASIDRTATKKLIAELDKTGLPSGTTMDTLENIDIPLGIPLGTFVSATNTTNGTPVPASVFGLNGTSLRIAAPSLKPYLRTNSSIGSFDTITIVTSTATVTFDAYIGSVHIKNVHATVNAAPDTLAPVTSVAPSISVAATDTTASVTQTINENGTGYYLVLPAASAAPSVAAVLSGTSFAMTGGSAAQVNLTGLTQSTSYKYYFVSKDSANNVQTAVSVGLAIDTIATPDTTLPTTPTLAIAAGAVVTNSLTPAITIANDTDNVGVTGWYVAETSSTTPANGAWSSTKPTSATITAGDGVKTMKVWTKDAAGNVSLAGSDTITLDQTAPSYAGESFPVLDTAGNTGSGTMSFDEAVHQVTSISFKRTIDNSPAGGLISVVSGLDSTMLGINYTAPNLPAEDVYIELIVVDSAGNSRTVRTVNNYTIF